MRQRLSQGLSGEGVQGWGCTEAQRKEVLGQHPSEGPAQRPRARSLPAEGAARARSVCGPGLTSDHHTGWMVQPKPGRCPELTARSRPQGQPNIAPGHGDGDGAGNRCLLLCVCPAGPCRPGLSRTGQDRALGHPGSERVLRSARSGGRAWLSVPGRDPVPILSWTGGLACLTEPLAPTCWSLACPGQARCPPCPNRPRSWGWPCDHTLADEV